MKIKRMIGNKYQLDDGRMVSVKDFKAGLIKPLSSEPQIKFMSMGKRKTKKKRWSK